MSYSEEEIYQEHVLDHYEDPFHRGECEHPTHVHEDDNPLCGDEIRIELQINDQGKIEDIYFNGDGCCISQASASMLVEQMNGKTIDDVKNYTVDDMLKLFGPRLTPNRQKCCLLSWKVLQSAIYSPLDEQDDSQEGNNNSAHFSGPHLGDES